MGALRTDDIAALAARVAAEIAGGPIVPAVTPDEIRRRLARYDFRAPVPLDEAAADAEDMMRRWHVQVTHPRYFGLFNPSVHAAAVVADLSGGERDRAAHAGVADRQVRPAARIRLEFHDGRRGGEPLGRGRRAHAVVPGVRR
jgi:hypothetical protein